VLTQGSSQGESNGAYFCGSPDLRVKFTGKNFRWQQLKNYMSEQALLSIFDCLVGKRAEYALERVKQLLLSWITNVPHNGLSPCVVCL